jgi:hypothetical protein
MKRLVNICLYILFIVAFVLPPFFPVGAADPKSWIFDFPSGFSKSIQGDALGKEGYSASIANDNQSYTVLQISGAVPGVTVTAEEYKNNPKYVQYLNQRSAIAIAGNSIMALYSNPPASTAMAIRDMGESLGILPHTVYAQGIGFAGLAPILPIWKAFRNIAYLILAIVMVVIGFMVMLRKKIDPKTVVTVQNALPRIIVALVLITFSYAIVGILIDSMYLLIYLALGIFKSTGYLDVSSRLAAHPNDASLYINGNLFEVAGAAFPSQWGLMDVASALVGSSTGVVSAVVGIGAIVGGILTAVGAGIIGVPILLATVGPAVLVVLILSLAILFTLVRLMIMFLNAYIQIVLALIIAPIQLLLEAVPGANGFSGWIKNLIANLSVFPIAAVLFMLSSVFSTIALKANGSMWAPPYLITGTTGNPGTIGALFAIGILMATPGICGSVKEALKAKSSAPGLGIGGIFAPVTGTVTSGLGIAQQFYYGQQALHGIGGLMHKKET